MVTIKTHQEMDTIITKTHDDTCAGIEEYEAWASRAEALGYRQISYKRVSRGAERPFRYRGTMRLDALPAEAK